MIHLEERKNLFRRFSVKQPGLMLVSLQQAVRQRRRKNKPCGRRKIPRCPFGGCAPSYRCAGISTSIPLCRIFSSVNVFSKQKFHILRYPIHSKSGAAFLLFEQFNLNTVFSYSLLSFALSHTSLYHIQYFAKNTNKKLSIFRNKLQNSLEN